MYREDGSDINLAICTSWYMDYLGVKREYESLNMDDPASPQHAIFVDGPYTFFRLKGRPTPPLSDDGSREYLKAQKKVNIVDYPGDEVGKRTAYLRKAEELEVDAIVIIDSDEYLHPDYRDWHEFRKWLVRYARSYDPEGIGMIFNLMSWIDKDYLKAYNTTEVNQFTLVPRVWHSPRCLEYYNGVHYWVRRKNSDVVGEKLLSTTLTIEHGIRIAQDSKLRDQSLLEARDMCNKNNIKHEDTLIKRYNSAHNIPYSSIYERVFGKERKTIIKTINPLLAVTVNHYDDKVVANLDKIVNVDKIYLVGYEDRWRALNKAREYFLIHEEYSHLILASDLLLFERSDINNLIGKMNEFDIISGWSIFNGNECTFSTHEVHFQLDKRVIQRWNPIALTTEKIDAKYTDLFLTGISRSVVQRNEFDNLGDIGFCWDVTHQGYQILIDPTLFVRMVSKPSQFNENPTLMFIKRHVELDDFME